MQYSEISGVAHIVASRIASHAKTLAAQFAEGPDGIRSFVLDDVLPADVLTTADAEAPEPSSMLRRADFRERKYVTAELGVLGPTLREVITGLADPRVAQAVSDVIGVEPALEVDAEFYNGGVTTMVPGDFMVPHLDNSHDRTRLRKRAVVMLFYLSSWDESFGGELALWGQDKASRVRSIDFRANRLVVLQTSECSWHSVEKITGPRSRTAITTYFYEPQPQPGDVRLTRYAGRPGNALERVLADGDFALRSAALNLGMDRLVKKRHRFTRPDPQ